MDVGDTDSVPLVFLLPDHPFDALQLVALVELQVRVEEFPFVIEVGLAVNVTVGAGVVLAGLTVTVADCEALPPEPEHVSV